MPIPQSWLDRIIQKAQEEGLFDDLEGKGRPINWEDESLVDEAWVMAFRLMRQHGFAPDWIELHKEIRAGLTQARQAVQRAWAWRAERLSGTSEEERRYIEAEWVRARAAFAEALDELNEKIAAFNLIVPLPTLQKFKLDVRQELHALGIDD